MKRDEPVRCHTDRDQFTRLNAQVGPVTRTVRGRRPVLGKVRQLEVDAARFCAQCPMKEECLRLGQQEKMTGVSGGRLLVHGKTKTAAPTSTAGERHTTKHAVA